MLTLHTFPAKKNLLFLLCVHPMGSSSVLIQYLHFFFLRPRKSLRCTLGRVRGCRAASSPLCLLPQRPPRSHEREEHAAAWGAGSGMQSSSRGQGQPAEQLKLCPGGEAESRAGGQGEKVAGRGTAVAGLLLWRKSCRRGACLQKQLSASPSSTLPLHSRSESLHPLWHSATTWLPGNQSFPTSCKLKPMCSCSQGHLHYKPWPWLESKSHFTL